MIKVSIYHNDEDAINGFKLFGHAGYAEHGQDIVCAAVSTLVINTVNSIEKLTSDQFSVDEDEDAGMLEFHITSELSDEAELLLNSMFLGLSEIQKSYGKKFIIFTSD